MLSFKKTCSAQQCMPLFLWRGSHSGACESLGSSPVKMSQAFHDSSIRFNFSYFHQKENRFKTPEMCLYLDSDVWAGCFTIIFAGSFHYFKPVSCWNQVLWKCCRRSTTLRSTSIVCGKGKHVWNSWNAPLFRLRRFRRMSHNYFCWIFSLF